MKISPSTEKVMHQAAAIIRSGGLVAFPTETVYGLGADAFNPRAVARIFEAKNRPYFDPLIVHIADLSQLSRCCRHVEKRAARLAGRFWPGPLTMVLPKAPDVPDIVTAGLDTVAVRMPRHLLALDLIRLAGTPIAAPSANPFGYISPTRAEHVLEQLGDRVDMIIDGGPCEVGLESTIVKIEEDERNLLLRPGGIAPEEIEDMVGPLLRAATNTDRPEAPGQLSLHYAPAVPVRIVESAAALDFAEEGAGYLLFRGTGLPFPADRSEVLSATGDLAEAAARLFTALHNLDKKNLRVVYAEAVPERGLGIAIMDRLRRAARRGVE